MDRYTCICGYVYDVNKGDPDQGIEPGTRFEDLPNDWACPKCGLTKDHFLKNNIKTITSVFKYYPFETGEKIYIEDGPRKGDWQVAGLTKYKVKLKCLRTFKEFEWDRFCFFVEKKKP